MKRVMYIITLRKMYSQSKTDLEKKNIADTDKLRILYSHSKELVISLKIYIKIFQSEIKKSC